MKIFVAKTTVEGFCHSTANTISPEDYRGSLLVVQNLSKLQENMYSNVLEITTNQTTSSGGEDVVSLNNDLQSKSL